MTHNIYIRGKGMHNVKCALVATSYISKLSYFMYFRAACAAVHEPALRPKPATTPVPAQFQDQHQCEDWVQC